MSDGRIGSTTRDDRQSFYVCGQCRDKQYYLSSEDPPIPCPDCGWMHKDRRKYVIPPVIKVDLSQF